MAWDLFKNNVYSICVRTIVNNTKGPLIKKCLLSNTKLYNWSPKINNIGFPIRNEKKSIKNSP